jgi:hypothetical protein
MFLSTFNLQVLCDVMLRSAVVAMPREHLFRIMAGTAANFLRCYNEAGQFELALTHEMQVSKLNAAFMAYIVRGIQEVCPDCYDERAAQSMSRMTALIDALEVAAVCSIPVFN